MIGKIRDFFWPVLTPALPGEERRASNVEKNDLAYIEKTDWDVSAALALEEARRLVADEEDRRKTAESKASNLLLLAAALVPLLTYLETAIWDANFTVVPTWLTLPLLALALAYFSAACVWAFRTVEVGTYHRVYPADLVRIWQDRKSLRRQLVAETLAAVRRNQEPVNDKVSASKMAHAFLLRAVLVFALLLVIRISFGLWDIVKQPLLDLMRCYLSPPF